jgi:hypothetical protein
MSGTVWIVSLEWNFPPSEIVGDTGIVSVHTNEADAKAAQEAEQTEWASKDRKVYAFPHLEDNDEEWDIDVHCSEHEVLNATL